MHRPHHAPGKIKASIVSNGCVANLMVEHVRMRGPRRMGRIVEAQDKYRYFKVKR